MTHDGAGLLAGAWVVGYGTSIGELARARWFLARRMTSESLDTDPGSDPEDDHADSGQGGEPG